jgi:hypothetical protein
MKTSSFAIHHVTPFDRAPVYSLLAGEVEVNSADDWREFMLQHAHHKLEPLHTPTARNTLLPVMP